MKIKNKNNKKIIRSSSTSLLFSNTNKLSCLLNFINEYKKVISITIDYLWDLEKVPSLLPKKMTVVIKSQTWLSARAIQCACKQASGIVRGTRIKQKKRLWQIKQFNKNKMFKKARKLQRYYDKVKVSKPNIGNICPELDERFVKMDFNNKNSFDAWITLTCLGNKMKLVFPIKKTKHFNKIIENGTIKKGIRISSDKITFNFLMNKPPLKTEGSILGVDIGIKDVCALSNNKYTNFKKDIHNHTLETIQKKLSRKKKGSKLFKKAQKHRTNYIKWYLNQIDFSNVKVLKIENIKNLRMGKGSSRYMSHWTYPIIKNKLEDLALWSGVQTIKISPIYTSQRCSKCGWTHKKNRKGKKFICTQCGNALDADHNASLNISFVLPEISKEEWLLHKNKNGFYWNVIGQEPIVPVVRKALELKM